MYFRQGRLFTHHLGIECFLVCYTRAHAIHVVLPGVKRTCELRYAAPVIVDKLITAVSADVVKRLDRAIRLAHDDDAFI